MEYDADYHQEEDEQEAADLEEPDQEESGQQEEPDQEESPGEESGEDQTEAWDGASEEDLKEGSEEGPEESTEEGTETVSGNDMVINGDVVIFPEGYDLSGFGNETPDTEAIVRAIEKQNENLTAGFVCTCFVLGLLAGAVIVAGFRLRRV